MQTRFLFGCESVSKDSAGIFTDVIDHGVLFASMSVQPGHDQVSLFVRK